MSTAVDRVSKWISKVNDQYEGDVAKVGGHFSALNMHRFSSGILKLDTALGGGWPFARVVTLAGDESTGKTLLTLKACEQVTEYDHNLKIHRSLMPPDEEFVPGVALFVDLEGSFDLAWARKNGFDDEHHVVARPEYAEQAVDMVTAAMHDNAFDLIVVDSVAAMTPTKEIEESTEDWQMGLAARIINKAMRRWNSRLNKASIDGNIGPCVMCINQTRIDLNVQFGDPRVLPGGRGQRFCSSVIVLTRAPKISDGSDKTTALGEFGGVTQKNKTYIPRLSFNYSLALRDTDGMQTGEVNNLKQLMDEGKRLGVIQVVSGKSVTFRDVTTRTQKELIARLVEDRDLYRLLWRDVVQEATKTEGST